jgi:glutamyl-tRNA synthetase
MTNSVFNVRFAPSPTGELHLGGARTALFNWLFAKHNNGKFFLRIEDTDTKRSREIYTDQILDSLSWLGLNWEEPLIYQSERLNEYKIHIKSLLSSGQLYHCFCSKNDLSELKDKGHFKYPGTCRELDHNDIKTRLNQGASFTYRFRIPDGNTKYEDMIYGSINVDHKELDDFIVIRSDGSPTYNFTAVVDDHYMDISHVIRGEDHVSNTPKQILLYKALGFNVPVFAHLPMILGADGKRLSKRHGAAGVQTFREEGYLPESLNNYLALLGWNPGTDEELFSSDDLIQKFNLSKVQKKGAIWDEKKMHWISGQHMMKTGTDHIIDKLRFNDPDWGKGSSISYLVSIVELLKVRAKSLSEFIAQSDYFFNSPLSYDQEALQKAWGDNSVNTRMQLLAVNLLTLEHWRKDYLQNIFELFIKEHGLGLGKIIMPIRLAVCGTLNGPAVYDILELLGKDETLKRINVALKELPK